MNDSGEWSLGGRGVRLKYRIIPFFQNLDNKAPAAPTNPPAKARRLTPGLATLIRPRKRKQDTKPRPLIILDEVGTLPQGDGRARPAFAGGFGFCIIAVLLFASRFGHDPLLDQTDGQ